MSRQLNDPLRAAPYLLAWSIPFSVLLGLYLGGFWTFFTVLYVFGLTPVVDLLVGTQERNPEEDASPSVFFDYVVRGWVVVHMGILLYGLSLVGSLPPLEMLGLTVSIGLVGGAGINVAHELMHRRGRGDRALAELLMSLVGYAHFCVEHVHGHHRHVATPRDPATAQLGESVYRFVPRSVFGGLRSAWGIETRRVSREGVSGSLWDRRVRYAIEFMVLCALAVGVAGLAGLLFFLVQGVVAVLQLEVINYLEHYGLQRRVLSTGRYERVRPQHSWNSAHRVTGWLLFGLPRHADHHFKASRPYPKLRHLPEAPQLPAGYATMFLCALVPPLWHRVMDPRALARTNS